MASTRSDISLIQATQAAIQAALAKITQQLTPRKTTDIQTSRPNQPPPPSPTKSPKRQPRNPTNDFRLDHLPIKTHQDHLGKWYGTSNVVWKTGDKVFYTTNSPLRATGAHEKTVTMTPVYIIGQNVEYPPSYEVSEVQHPEDHEV